MLVLEARRGEMATRYAELGRLLKAERLKRGWRQADTAPPGTMAGQWCAARGCRPAMRTAQPMDTALDRVLGVC